MSELDLISLEEGMLIPTSQNLPKKKRIVTSLMGGKYRKKSKRTKGRTSRSRSRRRYH